MSIKRLQPLEVPKSNSSENAQIAPFIKKEIPTIQFTHKLNGLDEKLRKMKITNYQSDFITQIENILALYDEKELHYNHELVLFIMNEVERYILKSKSGDSKKQLVIECCKKYFDNNIEILEVIINLLFPKIKQIKFMKRQGYKLLRFFSKVTLKVMSKAK